MRLDRLDIEAVARSRVSRVEGNKPTYWMGGALLAVVGGLYLWNMGEMKAIGLAIAGIGLLVLILYMRTLTKKQNIMKARLLEEWQKEQVPKK